MTVSECYMIEEQTKEKARAVMSRELSYDEALTSLHGMIESNLQAELEGIRQSR